VLWVRVGGQWREWSLLVRRARLVHPAYFWREWVPAFHKSVLWVVIIVWVLNHLGASHIEVMSRAL